MGRNTKPRTCRATTSWSRLPMAQQKIAEGIWISLLLFTNINQREGIAYRVCVCQQTRCRAGGRAGGRDLSGRLCCVLATLLRSEMKLTRRERGQRARRMRIGTTGFIVSHFTPADFKPSQGPQAEYLYTLSRTRQCWHSRTVHLS